MRAYILGSAFVLIAGTAYAALPWEKMRQSTNVIDLRSEADIVRSADAIANAKNNFTLDMQTRDPKQGLIFFK